jgi:small-conductance mechanosensitive channel
LVSFSISPSLHAAGPTTIPTSDVVIQYLDQTIDWYHQVVALDQSPLNTQEFLLRQNARQSATQVVRLGFDFGRAAAGVVETLGAPTRETNSTRGRNLTSAASRATTRAAKIQADIEKIEQQIPTTAPTSRPALVAKRDRLAAQLNLVTTQRDALSNYAQFVRGAESGDLVGLGAKVADLERSVPEILLEPQNNTASSNVNNNAANAAANGAQPPTFSPETAGMFRLISQMFALTGRMRQLNLLSEQAKSLRDQNERMRVPIREAMLAAVRRGDTMATTQETDDPVKLTQQRQELDQLTARFKQLTTAISPLGRQNVLLEASRENLLNWRTTLLSQYTSAVRNLLLRLGMVVATVLVIMGISHLWRRATFRYIHDARRRRQLLMVRRIVIGGVVTLIVIASIVTEVGSLATFAGLITAGIAVALQTVILSGVAYFFFIGRFGIRVGDRVTISNITGDVLEIGLFRLYLMELAGPKIDLHPTGRIVAFSNAVLFQPSAFYKQIPGAEYVWHEVSFTMASDTDYRMAEKRLFDAVDSVYAEYRDEIERQHAAITHSMQVQMDPPKPESRLRFVGDGLEFVVRYPVDIRKSAQIDDRITRRLLDTIADEPRLRLVSNRTPMIQAVA